MIDPRKMTRYGQSQDELEETLLFCVCVAGKNAMTTARLLDNFLSGASEYSFGVSKTPYLPFASIATMFYDGVDVAARIKGCGLGCYNHRAKTFRELVYNDKLDLSTCSTEELEKTTGIGMKTSRFFILHSRKGAEVAPVDTHVKKFLRDRGIIESADISLTPRVYLELEAEYIKLWRKERRQGETLASFDLAVWNHYAGHSRVA